MDWCKLYTGGHSCRVAEMSRYLLREMDLSGPEAALIVWAARLHDIGKIGLPNQILGKPGSLSVAEKRVLDLHPVRGAAWLLRYCGSRRGADIVRHHHERWDGEGYPDRLKGRDIPRGARLIAVADSFDALTSDRPYRTATSTSQALRILREGRGRQWDPRMVDALLRVVERGFVPGQERGQPYAVRAPRPGTFASRPRPLPV
jgi:HD-GYP domain-containing protein (c-di-GMP phosphodiesterase class II)